ncbi:MAG: flagellar hook-length control protein FliK [Gallionella sp.]|jgi:flagellar hook-length control protein FliK|nr:flagellar hook-length control protein FliK [Gallionella sp.]MCK9354961.1 flagellar hook-length control protein FliK [Gallionella sp.]
MNNLLISSAPQPSGNAANASQPDSANGANDPAAAPFAQVLARKVDKSPPPASDANANADASENSAALPPPDQAVVPVDALNAILSQIPVEMRGTNAMDRAAMLASGDRTAALDPATLRMAASSPATEVPVPASAKDGEAFHTELPGQSIPSNPLTGMDKNAAGKTSAPLAMSEQQLLTDALRQSAAYRQDLTTSLVQPAASQISAASISQATIAAMTGLSGNQPTGATQTISTPLSSPAWGEDFSQKVSWMISQKNQVAELHLNPPNLGPLDVVLKISDNQATALFTSPHAAVRDAVESAMPKLRELLADNGIMLSNATVGDQSPRDRSAENFADRKGGASSGSGSADDASETSGTLQTLPVQRHNGMVDTFA